MSMSTKDFLLRCGVRPDLNGYYYLTDLINRRREWLRAAEKERYSVTREYEEVAKKYKGCNAYQIDRACRFAIEKCYDALTPDNGLLHLFDNLIDVQKSKPNNATFICTAAEYLENIIRGL